MGFVRGALFFALLVAVSNCCDGETKRIQKRQSIIPYPRVGRSQWYMEDKRGAPGLIPFPRVGRSHLDEDVFHEMKRQLIPFPRVGKRQNTIIPFPRVGRSSAASTLYLVPLEEEEGLWETDVDNDDDSQQKRNGAGATGPGGMWFGPRLGRKKRSVDYDDHKSDVVQILKDTPWAVISMKGHNPEEMVEGHSVHNEDSEDWPAASEVGHFPSTIGEVPFVAKSKHH